MANNQTVFYTPRDTREIVNVNNIENPLIYFNYFLDFKDEKFVKRHLKRDKSVVDLALYIKKRKNNLACSLAEKYDVRGIQAQISWRLVVGLGKEHVQETSMCLDYIYGIPYIPASAIKGVVRHYYIQNELGSHFPEERLKVLENILDKFEEKDLEVDDDKLLLKYKVIEKGDNGDKVELLPLESTLNFLKKKPEPIKNGQRIFGTQGKKGEVIFLDAVIDSLNRGGLATDVMTPHYGQYYRKEKPPIDSLAPTPITFLTIEQAKFNFYFLGKNKKLLDELWDGNEGLLYKALVENGIGAKTSVGYGYFENIKDITADITPRNSEEQEQAVDLGNMTEIEKTCYFLEKYKNAEEPQKYENYSHDVFFQLDQFEEEGDKVAVAKALKSYWKKLGKWEGKLSKKQKPKVDKIKNILKEK